MKLQDAINQSANQPALGDSLIIVGSLEKDTGTEKVRIYPNPTSRSQYILLDAASVDGDVVDVTDAYRKQSPGLRSSIFSIPVKKGSTFQLITELNVKVEDIAALSKLSVDQRGGGGCSCKQGATNLGSCYSAECTTVGGYTFPCIERGTDGNLYCSHCCAWIAAKGI
jgi:hypothetical protein